MSQRKYDNISLHKKTKEVIKILIEDPRILERNVSDFVHTAVKDKIDSLYILFPDLKDTVLASLGSKQ